MSRCRAFYFAFYDFSFSHYVGQSPFLRSAVCIGERGAVRCSRRCLLRVGAVAARWVPVQGLRLARRLRGARLPASAYVPARWRVL